MESDEKRRPKRPPNISSIAEWGAGCQHFFAQKTTFLRFEQMETGIFVKVAVLHFPGNMLYYNYRTEERKNDFSSFVSFMIGTTPDSRKMKSSVVTESAESEVNQ